MSAVPPSTSSSRFVFDPKTVFVDFFQSQDTTVKAALVFSAVVVSYSLLSSTFTAALAGGYIGARLGNYSMKPLVIPK